jgi:methylenetetrahydrofolate dehydrogenase (NADP+)/methenyltetrahydrofolate cyclohydrolase
LPAELIDGVAVARKVRAEVAQRVALLGERGIRPGLTVVLVGDDPASAVYVRAKEKACIDAGMHGETVRLPAATPQAELLARLDALNADPRIHGILVQMPLPPQIDPQAVAGRIDPRKDVDGVHPVNVGKVLIGDPHAFAPCTPAGVQVLLREYGVSSRGKHCVIVGRSMLVGKPMASLLIQAGEGGDATVTVCHSRTPDLTAHTLRADIIIAAVGRVGLIRGSMVRPGAVVIDVGINRIADPTTKSGTRLLGDVEFETVRDVASKITPVPGGVGPMTIAMLLKNTVRAAELQA